MNIALKASSFHLLNPSIDRPPNVHIGERTLGPTESKIDQRESARISHARGIAAVRDEFRGRVAEMVQDQEVRAGSRMLAYRAVGRLLAVSDTWVRRLLYGQPVRIELETVAAADSAYEAHCARRRARAAAELAAAAVREGRSDAILASLRGGAAGSGRGEASQSSAPMVGGVGSSITRQGGRS